MSEAIVEMIVPGTYIEVRAEGLLSVGAIATGNIGLIGTAEMGSADIQSLSSFEEGRARFGERGDWDPRASDTNLTLVRALRLLFDDGASTVYARRVFDPTKAVAATYTLGADGADSGLKLRARTPGTWGNRLQVRIEPAEQPDLVNGEVVVRSNGTLSLSARAVFEPPAPSAPALPPGDSPAPPSEPSLGVIAVRENGLLQRYQLKKSAPSTQVAQLNPSNRTFTLLNRPAPTAEIRASYYVPAEDLRKVTFRYGNLQEVYIVPSLSYLAQMLKDELNPSRLVEVVDRTGDGLPKATTRFEPFAAGDNGTVSTADYQSALDEMVDRDVQILVVPRNFTQIKSAILGHLEKTENLGRERIAVVGADSSDVQKILENANEVADKRLILVAPGIQQEDPNTGRLLTLPPSFAAAAVAGRLSSVSPHVSLTNKTLPGIEKLATEYNYGDLKALLQNRVLPLQTKRGVRVTRAITTDDGAFKQISVRRIVDYAKEGTRRGANQYIGKLNNRRVRENLRTTLDGFLADLVLREFLTKYNLEVKATRAMEIRGEVLVTMDLKPTFSIDYIRVVMTLS
jgi:Phage tail sheath protein subtilisin-like domain/Phage tail sheath C-terminal domain